MPLQRLDDTEDRANAELLLRSNPGTHQQIAYDLVTYGRAWLVSLEIRNDSPLEICRAMLMTRLIDSAAAVEVLILRGFSTDADGTIRSMMECYFRLVALCVDPTSIDRFTEQELPTRRRILQDLVQYFATKSGKYPEGFDEARLNAMLADNQTEIEKFAAHIGRAPKEITTWTWASLAKDTDYFHAAYGVRCLALHHSPIDLVRHAAVDESGRLIGIRAGGDILEREPNFYEVSYMLQHGMRSFAAAIGVKVDDPLAGLLGLS